MINVDQLLNELFGAAEEPPDAVTESLAPLAAALAPDRLDAVALLDDQRKSVALWKRPVPASVAAGSSLEVPDPVCDFERTLRRFPVTRALQVEPLESGNALLVVRFGDGGKSSGLFVGCLHLKRSAVELEQYLQAQLPWVRAVGTTLFTVARQADKLAHVESRLEQHSRQYEVFRDEHERMVIRSLEEADARLRAQRRYAAELEFEVGARTRRLMQSEAATRAILDAAPDGIFTFDAEGMIRSFNRSAELMFGRPTSEVVGQSLSLLLPTDSAAVLRELSLVPATPVEPRRFEGELSARRRDGSEFPTQLSISELRGDTGQCFIAIVRDITERREAEELIRSQNERLAAATRAKSEFLANMSHEIRTPMTAILGYADLLRESLKGSANVEAIDTIKHNGRHLLELINEILDLSKVEAGKLEVERIPCCCRHILDDVVSLMRVRADAKRLFLETEFATHVPDPIATDPTRLRQVLMNLVGNAIKFTHRGGVRIVVSTVEKPGQKSPLIRFEVIDSGIGITEEQMSRLFQPFAQADSSTTRQHGGTGLGLTISKRLVELLGGTITAESVIGQGSRFAFTIATCPPAEAIAARSSPAPAINLPEVPAKFASRVLVAEDGIDNQRLVRMFLQKAGITVTIAENGEEAVRLALQAVAADAPYDVILMDIQMPILDGYDATRKLREAGYAGPIVALTAHAMSDDRGKCLACGCDDYLTKPIDRASLLQIVHRYTNQAAPASRENPAEIEIA